MPTAPEEVRPPSTVPPHATWPEWRRVRARLVVTDTSWVWVGAVGDDGYGRLWSRPVAPGERSPMVRPSRWIWSAFNGPIPPGMIVRHECDLPLCGHPSCLLLGDQADNVWDMVRRDRLTNLGRLGRADKRGFRAASLAVRRAVLDALSHGVTDPGELGAVVEAARAEGDPLADQIPLW